MLGFSNPNEGVAHNPDCIHLWNRGDLRIPAYGSVGINFFYPSGNPSGYFCISIIETKRSKPVYRWQKVVEMCKENNRFAQNRLYEGFAARLFRLCMRYVRHSQDAEEVLMNGFLKFFRGLPDFDYRDDHSLEAWLKRIMINEALMHLRQQKALPKFTDTDEADSTYMVEPPDESIDAEAIYAALIELPTGYRMVFNLYVVEGFKHEEIAQQLSIAVGTSKSQLSKARAMLQQILKKRGYEQYGTI